MTIAVIPARGGSKRIPRKNIKLFGGSPMIARSLEIARASACFDRIIVSTDDPEIAEVAKAHGGEVPFIRPKELSDDLRGTVPVIAHATQWLLERGDPADPICCIYATAPFLEAEDLQRGLEALRNSGADYAFSVTSYAFPIQRALRVTESGRVAMFEPEHSETRSQDLVEAWHDAGQFYWGRAAAWLEGVHPFVANSVAIVLPRHRVQDIDTPEDWQRAELMLKALEFTERATKT